MKFTKRFLQALIPSLLLLLPNWAAGQLQVTSSTDADSLVRSLVGPGVIVSNATLLANGAQQAGFFNGSNSNIGIDSGILLTSGDVNMAIGPNVHGFAGTGVGGPGYPLLTQMTGVATFDRCVLQFDVVPYADTLAFQYVFASEEYPEYVCAQVNDAFGFFISGPNPSGGNYSDENVALIPGTNIGVSINSVNPGVPGANGNAGNCISLGYSQYYLSNAGGATVEYDGFTQSLVGKIFVVSGSTYTFKLAIADGGDAIFDSGAFLEEGSLKAISHFVNSRTVAGNTYPSIIEECLDGEIIIRRNGPNTQTQTVKLATGGTATNGVDYTTIPDSITIPAGQDSVVLNVQGFQDGLGENFESLIVYLLSQHIPGQIIDSTLIYIEDSMSIQILPGDTAICVGDSLQLEAVGGSNFQWSPPDGLSTTGAFNPIAAPTTTTTYTVSGSVLGCAAASKAIKITVHEQLTATMSPDTVICMGSSVQLNTTITPSADVLWSPSAGLSSDTVQNPYASPLQTTTYTLTATLGQNCSVQDSVKVTVNPQPSANVGPDVSFCAGTNGVQLQAAGGVSYEWTPATGLSNPFTSNPTAQPDTTTNYTVQVTDANGCKAEDVVKVTVNPAPSVNAGPDHSICAGESAQLQGSGAMVYQWQGTGISCFNCANPTATPPQSTTYTLVGTDANGCTNMDEVTVNVSPNPVADAGPDLSICGDTGSVILEGNPTASGGTPGYAYQWIPWGGIGIPGPSYELSPTATTSFTLVVTDSNGCTDQDSATVFVSTGVQATISGLDTICAGECTQLLGQALSGTPAFSYTWSSGQSSNSIIACPLTPTTYFLTITDGVGCQHDTSMTVAVRPSPSPAINGLDTAYCENELPVTLNVTPSGGVLSGPGISGTDFDPGAAGVGDHKVLYEVTDGNGCVGSDSSMVEVYAAPPKPLITLSNDSLFTAGGYAGYQWSFNGVPIANATDTLFVVGQMGDYAVEVTNEDGCTTQSDEMFVDLTGINLLKDIALIEVYPNPASEVLWVRIVSRELLKPTIRLLSVNGAGVWEETRANQLDHLAAIPLNRLASGLYLLEIRTEKGNVWQRVIVE